mmetsp:Transcript_6999/g.11320  ORF Transcript_6999/g.11320 Transcript_6999/m.11320 type:complete len:200 (-) Transcript_6999:1222-1821(-)
MKMRAREYLAQNGSHRQCGQVSGSHIQLRLDRRFDALRQFTGRSVAHRQQIQRIARSVFEQGRCGFRILRSSADILQNIQRLVILQRWQIKAGHPRLCADLGHSLCVAGKDKNAERLVRPFLDQAMGQRAALIVRPLHIIKEQCPTRARQIGPDHFAQAGDTQGTQLLGIQRCQCRIRFLANAQTLEDGHIHARQLATT